MINTTGCDPDGCDKVRGGSAVGNARKVAPVLSDPSAARVQFRLSVSRWTGRLLSDDWPTLMHQTKDLAL